MNDLLPWLGSGYVIGFLIGKALDRWYYRWVRSTFISKEQLEEIRSRYHE